MAEDNADGIRIARDIVRNIDWNRDPPPPPREVRAPVYDIDGLCAVVPADYRRPYDCREVIARIAVKHGSKMIQAVANASAPQITIVMGGSFGTGNYGMCGRGFGPQFTFAWPNSRTSVMGGEQVAKVISIITCEKWVKAGKAIGETEEKQLAAIESNIIKQFDAQSTAFAASARLFDDGIIDPRDTRRVLGYTLSICRESQQRLGMSNSFGVARL